MKIPQLAELLQRPHLTTDSSMGLEHPCTLYKGPAPAPAAPSTPPWTLHEQSALRNTKDSRQALRKHVRMLVNFVGRDWVKAIAANEVHENASNDTFNGDATDADAEQTGGKSGGGGSRKSAPSTRGRGKSGLGMGGSSKGLKRKTNDDEDEYSEGGDGGNDRSVPQKKTKTTGGKQQRRKADTKESEPEQQNAEADRRTADLVEEVLKSNDPDLKNASRIAKVMRDVKLKRFASPPAPSIRSEISLDTLASRSSTQGRNINAHSRSHNQIDGYWLFDFRDGAKVVPAAHTKVQHTTLAGNASDAELSQLHLELAKQYNSWPWNLDTLNDQLKQMLILAAAQSIWANPLELEAAVCRTDLNYSVTAYFINASTGRREALKVTAVATKVVVANVVVPPMPTFYVLNKKDKSRTLSTPDSPFHIAVPASIKSASRAANTSQTIQHCTEDALYWVALQLQGLIATPDRVMELMSMYREQIGLSKAKMAKTGLYGGDADLYFVWHWANRLETRVDATKKIVNDLGLKKLDLSLRIYSINASRATPVLETIVQLFCAGFDIRYVWIEAAKTADCVNLDIRDGVAPSSRCDCDETQVSTEMHICEGCAKPVLCKDRAYDSLGRLVDMTCLMRDRSRALPGKAIGDSLAAYLAYRSLWRNFQEECAVRQLDPTSKPLKAIFDKAFKNVKQGLPGSGIADNVDDDLRNKFVDEWTGMAFDVAEDRVVLGNNPSRRRYAPHGITLDSIHRQGHPDDLDLKHSGENVAVTTNACQMAHSVFNPGSMHEIAAFLSETLPEQQVRATQAALIAKLTAMAVVNCKRAYINAGKGTKLAKYQKIMAEAVAGRPTPGEPGPWEAQAQKYAARNCSKYKPNGKNWWSDEKWERMRRCAQSTAKFFGVKLFELVDKTLWIGGQHTHPVEFNDRNAVGNLLLERLHRMRVKCNKKWKTTDTDEMLYQEIVFQHCCTMTEKPELQWLKLKYGDRLGLPLVLFMHSPLRLSIAHRSHGFGMLTGWVSESPIDVAERLENDSNNNMLIESWYVNCAKLDMADEYYDELDRILKSVSITDKRIYAPETVPGASDVILSDEEQVGDEYSGGAFNVFDSSAVGPDDDMDIDDPNNNAGVESTAGLSKPVDLPEIFSQEIAELYQTIFNDAKLRDQLMTDAGLQRLLGKLRQIADDVTNPKAMDLFSETMAQVHREYMDIGVDSDDMLE